MRIQAFRGLRSFLIIGLCVATMASEAWPQENGPPPDDRGASADRKNSANESPGAAQTQAKKQLPSRPAVPEYSDGLLGWLERMHIARPRSGSSSARSTETRTRWLMGRDIRYAPGSEPDSPQADDPPEDPALARASYETVRQKPQAAGAAASATNAVENGQVPPLDPLPPAAAREFFPALQTRRCQGRLRRVRTSRSTAAGMDRRTTHRSRASCRRPSKNRTGLCKRFLRGYPTLVSWFPEHLGTAAKASPGLPIIVGGDWLPSDRRGREERRSHTRAGERAEEVAIEAPGAPRRSPPSPWDSPPFPGSEYQGYPLIGTPTNPTEDPLQKALLLGPNGDWFRDTRIEVHGWVTVGGNWSNANRSNLPTAYWIVPNSFQVDQAILRFEREIDWVQTDHIDWGFRWVNMYGIDYRYTTAGGIFSQQLLYHNNLYGYDPVEFWAELYIPNIFEGMVIRLGRWIACPDIEAQYAPDNYLASHSLLFTYDTYTQTGCMFSFQLNQRNMVQGAIQSGTDMAPWYAGALATGFFGWRWISESNNDAFYTCLNNINNGKFRYF